MNDKQQPYNGQIDEALLTAYALKQLEGPERALVEAALKTDHKAQEAVEEIREVAGHLRDAVSHEEDYAPSPNLREMIEQRLEGMTPVVATGEEASMGTRTRKAPRRRRWAVLALTSAAVLLLAVTIPSLPMFQRGTTSDVAMEMSPSFKAEAPAADGIASTEAIREEMGLAERGEGTVGVEAKQLASDPLREAPASAPSELADMNVSTNRSTPAKSDEDLRAYAKEASKPSAPIMKGSSSYARPEAKPERESLTRPRDSEKREDASRVVGKSGEKNRAVARVASPKGAPPNYSQPKATQAPAAPTPPPAQAWSHRQAAGPAATPVPYPNAAPDASGQVPLAQSQMMPRARSAAIMPRTGPAPTLTLPQLAAEPYGAPAPNDAPTMPVPAGPQIELQVGQTDAKPEPALQKKMPQKPQSTYNGAAGMGGGMRGGYGEQPQDQGFAYGMSQPAATPPPTSATPPAAMQGRIQLGESIESKLARDAQRQSGEGGNVMGYGMDAGRSQGQSHALGLRPAEEYIKGKLRERGGVLIRGRGLPREQVETEGLAGAYNDAMQRVQLGVAPNVMQQMISGNEQYAPVIENPFKSPVQRTRKYRLRRRRHGLLR